MNAEEKKDDMDTEINTDSAADSPNPAPAEDASNEQKLREEMMYLRAEFENAKRRLLRDQDNAIRFANEKVFSELLSVVDLFDRALASSGPLKENAESKSFVTGIELTHHELVQILERFGVELTGTVGEKFDPSRHEAISQMPGEAAQVDKVVAVAQKGCLYQGRLLKPAKVVVGIPKE
jgi:molecular chaperone GrpE